MGGLSDSHSNNVVDQLYILYLIHAARSKPLASRLPPSFFSNAKVSNHEQRERAHFTNVAPSLPTQFVPFVFQNCPSPVSGPQEIEVAGHEHGVEPIERLRQGIIVSADVMHKLSAKAFP
jgi:hypothetical protein